MTAHVIAIANQKGGVGKTTTAVNLSTALAAAGKKVLLLDFDPQGNASTAFGLTKQHRLVNSYNFLLGEVSLFKVAQKTMLPNLWVIPSSLDLLAAEVELVGVKGRSEILKNVLTPHLQDFDYVFIDCPPSMGILTLNAMVAATGILIALQCEYYALEGLSYLVNSLEKVKQTFNPSLSVWGILLTMIDRRSSLSCSVAKEAREVFGNLVFNVEIPRNIKVSEAPSYGKPVLIYDVKSAGALAYMNLAREILQREKVSRETFLSSC